MENKKDIGKAFQEKLDGLQKSPRESVWDSVKADLDRQKPKGGSFRFFKTWIVTVAVLLLAGIFTYPLWENYIPRLYIKMPENSTQGEQNDTATQGKENNGFSERENATDAGNNQQQPVGKDDNATTTNTTTTPAVNSAYKPEASTSEKNNAGTAKATSTPEITSKEAPAVAGNNNTSAGTAKSGTAKRTAAQSGTNKLKNTASVSNPATKTGKTAINQPETLPETAGKNANGAIVQESKSAKTILNKNNEPAGTAANNSKISGQDNAGNLQSTNAPETVAKNNSVPRKAEYNSSDKAFPQNSDKAIAAATDVKTDSVPQIIPSEKLDFTKIADSLDRLYGRDKEKNEPKIKEAVPYKQFSLYALAAPTQYSLQDNGLYLDASLGANSTSSKTSLAYGGYFGFYLNRTWGFRTGIIKSGFEQATEGVTLQNTYIQHGPDDDHPEGWIQQKPPRQFNKVKYREGVSNNSIRQQLSTGTDEMGQEIARVNLVHRVEFLEIPIEVTCRLYDGKFGIGLIGAFSIRYLKENSIYAENSVGSVLLGSYKRIEDMNYSAGFGANFYYEFTPGFQLNIDPMFKYYFSDSPVLRPHTYSIQAGLQYNFDIWDKKE